MNKQRLQILADHLKSVPLKALNMEVWRCGTTACAFGHACEIPSFVRAGLAVADHGENCYGQRYWPTFLDCEGFEAAELFFEITSDAAQHLFDLRCYTGKPRPATVAKRIEKLVAKATPTKQREAV